MTTNTGQFTRARLSQAYERKSAIRFHGEKFYSLRAAERYAELSEQFLRRHKKASPLLGGRDMRVRTFKDGLGQEREYFAEGSLNDLMKAVEQLPLTPEVPRYCSYDEAPEEAGASLDTVKDLKNNGYPRFGIKPFKEKRVWAKDRRGHVVQKSYLPKGPLNRYRKCSEKAAVVPKDKMTVAAAARLLGVPKVTVISWIRKGRLSKSADQSIPGGANGSILKGFHLSRKEVKEFAESRKKEIRPFGDSKGQWYPERLAEETNPRAKGYTLRRYRNKPCPQLNGAVLEARRIPWPEGMHKNNHHLPWAYLDKCIERFGAKEPVHPEQTARDEPVRYERLNDTAREILAAVEEQPYNKGPEIAAFANYPYNSYFRSVLAKLVQAGVLQNDTRGYSILHLTFATPLGVNVRSRT